jgi:hypothetical protein
MAMGGKQGESALVVHFVLVCEMADGATNAHSSDFFSLVNPDAQQLPQDDPIQLPFLGSEANVAEALDTASENAVAPRGGGFSRRKPACSGRGPAT